ncbi:hypothetical protein OEB99_15460 [Actinotalea sp. M2MS4P-6]|uniref:hypothetical protein n=1 Tax=Actinotalea sp. M2MS4P-6 TaxID=2983762 RepID=UPI0021E44C43|nr:hypothetical protein [Actinotalea sp. M2MS4P-6]MCV2395712.1 hypothetical protein [Actinotalea sp. M2MS4P-6]
MQPPFVRAKFIPWYRSVVLAAGLGLAIWMWFNGYHPPQPPAGTASYAWVPLAVDTALMLWWHHQAEQAWMAAHRQPTV